MNSSTFRQLYVRIYSKKALGISDENITKDLIAEGWNDSDIKYIFTYLESQTKKKMSLRESLMATIHVYIAISIFIVLFAGMGVFFYYFRSKTTSYSFTAPLAVTPNSIPLSYGVHPSLSDPDFFAKVKNQFLQEKIPFVEVDLSSMITRVYKEGSVVVEVPIKTKGKEGSWWETPAGLYKIETKEKSHYSSMGHVYQPWSMQFQGNFFIHGIPTYEDGTQVSSSFSGGCVRLLDEDAKKIYESTTLGMPILVYEKDFTSDTFSYTKIMPNSTGSSTLAVDIGNNFVFMKNNSLAQIPIQGITKLMTALIATEYIDLEKKVVIMKEDLAPTNIHRLKVGMKIDVYQLLFPLLRESSNEAAEALARMYGKESFIEHMNEKAKAIGMTHTTFVDVTGNSLENISTPEDLFVLTKYIYNNRNFIFAITSEKVRTDIYGTSIFSKLGDASVVSQEKQFFGGVSGKGKNMYPSNYAFSVFEIPLSETTRPIFILIFDASDEKADTQNLITYIINNYK